ncbi:unnamed protein product [Durusdinium trenchii]|uniref:Peroxisomal membrane protein PEX16 n=1 Tax=Durusdinium trenchii TaxID=1381693 RepID=A0ABP0NEK9_9DINO
MALVSMDGFYPKAGVEKIWVALLLYILLLRFSAALRKQFMKLCLDIHLWSWRSRAHPRQDEIYEGLDQLVDATSRLGPLRAFLLRTHALASSTASSASCSHCSWSSNGLVLLRACCLQGGVGHRQEQLGQCKDGEEGLLGVVPAGFLELRKYVSTILYLGSRLCGECLCHHGP